MYTPDDDELQRSLEELRSGETLTLERLVRAAPFPIYGLIETPGDLTLRGLGYTTADAGWDNPTAPPRPNLSQFLWQATLSYGYPSATQDLRMRLEIITTATTRLTVALPRIEDLLSAYTTHYQSADEIPPLGSQAASFIIERYAIVGGQALATVKYAPDAPTREPGVLLGSQAHYVEDASSPLARAAMMAAPPPVHPEWSFTLRSPEMWVEAQAYGWTQNEIMLALHQLATISDRPDVVARYDRGM
ncbi:MAG TPA: hypothetical protein VFS83_02090 [Ktedonobacterales bacterium]|nr:hypothetical protein [Ktedonobacterales bacterium]